MILFSILTPLEDLLRNILEWLHGTIGLPWAWAIVALTVMVRLLMVPLAVKQIHSMQAMQAHMPEMKAIQQRYKHDKEKRNQELMKFYRDNRVNPAAPCLPLLVQFPVFIALYLVLRQFSKHPPAGSLSWFGGLVPDITAHANAHWSGYLLLAIYVGSQLASTYFMSTTMDKTQRTMMMILPVAFVPVIVNFPVGLVIYWVTTNLWTVGQGLVTRQLMPKAKPRAEAVVAGRRRSPSRRAATAPRRPRRPSRPLRLRSRAACDGRRRRQGDDGGPPPGRGDRRDRRRGEVGGAPRAREAPSGARQGRRSLPGRVRRRARAARSGLRARAGRRAGRRGGCAGARRTATASWPPRCATCSSGSPSGSACAAGSTSSRTTRRSRPRAPARTSAF